MEVLTKDEVRKVTFRRCTINSASFHGTYFFKGLTMEDCEFNNAFYFDCGGHNFNGFVDFFDVWFMGPVEIKNCSFNAGTNLLCDMLAFEVEPMIANNKGNLRIERNS